MLLFRGGENQEKKSKSDAIFGLVQSKQAQVNSFFSYGKCFNISAELSNISKDNFESVKLYLTDGNGFEKSYKMSGKIEEGNLFVTTTDKINDGLILDDLTSGEYIVLLRLKLNNSVNPKYYSFSNKSQYPNIEYYTVSNEGKNNKVNIEFKNKTYKNQDYAYLSINVAEAQLPAEVYDIVIDAGHGGKDPGEKVGTDKEADIALTYSEFLKEKLEAQGLKVKLTRDDTNTSSYTYTNMYDADGRITIACSSKAKKMISFHMNNGNQGLRGVEIYCPCKSNLEFAQNMANKIIEYTDVEYSNNNSFKKGEGVYVRNFTSNDIKGNADTATKKGYAPYNITLDTPYLYTIREVGGIATNAYVDGRNPSYAANKYFNSNQGIECYQIEMGYMKKDLATIKTQVEQYVSAIAEAIIENL